MEQETDFEVESSEGATTTPVINPAAVNTPKNFRHHPDMENFYRFIHENDLREEALEIVKEIINTRALEAKAKK